MREVNWWWRERDEPLGELLLDVGFRALLGRSEEALALRCDLGGVCLLLGSISLGERL